MSAPQDANKEREKMVDEFEVWRHNPISLLNASLQTPQGKAL